MAGAPWLTVSMRLRDRLLIAGAIGLALVLRDVLERFNRVLGDAPYNVVVHDGPRDTDAGYHWWVEVVPRLSGGAGFEVLHRYIRKLACAHIMKASLRRRKLKP